jgi:quinol-cytochrome oxidoreductase complex cytochrome b subunit
MWRTDTLWFDVAVVMSIFAVGGVVFGRFEQHKPHARRVLKQILVTAVVVGVDVMAGRAWAFGVLAIPLLAAVYVHLVWLPKHGINGFTAEPYDKYLALVGGRRPRPGS